VKLALYPGSFDPVTNGHLDTAYRTLRIFDQVVMAVFDRPNRNLLFSTEERVDLLREATRQHGDRIRIESYSVLTMTYARQIGAHAIVRGLRDSLDFEREFQTAQINQTIDPGIDIIFFMASRQFTFLSASTVREISSLGGDVSQFVPPHVEHALERKFRDRA
jgi:pantetheine-phosphate adenylyltransferase